MNILYTCWRLRDLLEEYIEFCESGNETEASNSLKRIRKTVGALVNDVKAERMDSAFFAGELDGKLGEKDVQYVRAW